MAGDEVDVGERHVALHHVERRVAEDPQRFHLTWRSGRAEAERLTDRPPFAERPAPDGGASLSVGCFP